MRNKKFVLGLLSVIIIAIIVFFYYKIKNNGNNIISSSDDILNISSYEAEIAVEITSNKNTNKYLLKQWYESPNMFKQEVIEPITLNGLTTTFDGKSLKIENSKLDLLSIYEDYNNISDNQLFLSDFIEDFKNGESYKEINEENVILSTQIRENNKYTRYKTLYLNSKTNIPEKLEITDDNKKILVYILYNEIIINNKKY